jgi:hypothetical protein
MEIEKENKPINPKSQNTPTSTSKQPDTDLSLLQVKSKLRRCKQTKKASSRGASQTLRTYPPASKR